MDNQYKLYQLGPDRFELYHLADDLSEETDAAERPEVVQRMRAELEVWRQSVTRSYHGKDYPTDPQCRLAGRSDAFRTVTRKE